MSDSFVFPPVAGSGGGGGLVDGDYGDVVVSGGGSVITIDTAVVTFAKFQNITADRLLGRNTIGAGPVEEISLGSSLIFNGTGILQRAALTGDVTAATDGNATTIAANAVGNTKIRDSGALSVIGRSANATGDPADISAVAASDAVLRESGSTVGFGTVATAGIANDAITFPKMQNVATDSLIGRDTAGTGDPENILLNATLSMDGSGNLQRAALTGDVTASAGSNATTIANNAVSTAKIADDAVTYAKIQNISATDRILGRSSAGAGDTQEIVCTATGRSIIDDASVAAVRTTLGLGTLAVQNSANTQFCLVKMFNGRELVSVAGTLALVDATIDNATDDDGHTIGVLMADGVETWVGFSFVVPEGFGSPDSFAVQVGIRAQGAVVAGDLIDIDIVGMVVQPGQSTTGGSTFADFNVFDISSLLTSGQYGFIDLPDGGGGLISASPGQLVKGVIKRDARVTNADDTYAQAIRLLWIKLRGNVSVS